MRGKTLLCVLLALYATSIKAQVPRQLNYQGIARTATGQPISYHTISVRISLLDSAAGGVAAYRETRKVVTNYVGLFNIVIGGPGATELYGSMANVQWATGKKYIKLEIGRPRGSGSTTTWAFPPSLITLW